MNQWGNILLELTSADPEKIISEILGADIQILHVKKVSELTFQITSAKTSFSKIQRICDRSGANIQICRRMGLYWGVKSMLKRPVLMIGILVVLIFTLFLPTRVFFVRVHGNESIPQKLIVAVAQKNGIHFGASRRDVRSEKVKNALLSDLPQLQWVGVNTSGCVANIFVREREQTEKKDGKKVVSSIVADRDGYILSMEVSSGNPIAGPGQFVKKGQVIVSGYTDCGIYIQAVRSEAEIIGQTIRTLRVVTPGKLFIRQGSAHVTRRYSLLIGKKRINLWKGSGILSTTCGRMYKEKYATLPGGFRLPIAVCVEEYIIQDVVQEMLNADDAQLALSDYGNRYLCQQMVAGSILDREEWYSESDGLVCMDGEYACQEVIGRERKEMIGE